MVVVEDTDAWSVRSDGADVAEAFFTRVMRPLVSDADVTVVVAVQDRWTSEPYYEDVAGRAIARLPMPMIQSRELARVAVELVCRRRVERVLPSGKMSDPLGELFTSEALDMLAATLAEEGSFRNPLEVLRDTLDHFSDALPERIDRKHLIEGGS